MKIFLVFVQEEKISLLRNVSSKEQEFSYTERRIVYKLITVFYLYCWHSNHFCPDFSFSANETKRNEMKRNETKHNYFLLLTCQHSLGTDHAKKWRESMKQESIDQSSSFIKFLNRNTRGYKFKQFLWSCQYLGYKASNGILTVRTRCINNVIAIPPKLFGGMMQIMVGMGWCNTSRWRLSY